ncbi:MAG: hypothetical protein N3F03_03995 [Ignavibacteria bacterium]|nr:hypothetical protein [Ignavibacteria bacterium]
MAFTGKEEHQISLEEAIKLIQNFRSKQKGEGIKAHYFGKEALMKLLEQEGCVGLRIYYASQEDGTPELVIVGVNEEGKDLVGMVLDRSWFCPPYCDGESMLNK